jgi:cell division protein FtsW
MKIAALIYFADYLARKKDDLHLFKVGIINVGLVVGAIGLLLLLEPDFGTAVVITAAVAFMMFLAGVRFWHFIISISVAAGLMVLIMWMEPYRVARLLSYQDPWADPFGSGFQLVQALIAIGRGEWFGIGLGGSIQKLFYLPHAGNDFLIAIVGEELGAVGIFSVLGLFALFLFRVFAIARRALNLGQRFSGFLAQGIGILITLQAFVHIGVNTGLLPTKGLTLPMMSYGGSSMISNLAAVGLLLAIDRHSRPQLRGNR